MHATLQMTVALVALAAFGAAGRSSAEEAESAFARLDADQGGTITWAEAYDVRTRAFLDMDTGKDGIVSVDEFHGSARPLSTFDSDGDGVLQLAEFLEGHRSMFDRFDKDANDVLTVDKFHAAQSAARGN